MLYSRLLSCVLILSFLAPTSGLAQTKPNSKKKPAATRSTKKSTATARAAQRKRVVSEAEAARARRLKRAFVASSDLKPMAKQLLEQHSKAAFTGVERYAKFRAVLEELAATGTR